MGVYDWLFYKFPKLDTNPDGILSPVQAYFRGEFSIPGSQITAPYRACMKEGVISDEPHFHRDEEYLAFVGHDLRDAFESFDAEIELYLGEDIDNMEKIVITEPSMIRIPQFYWHGPIIIKRLGKPLFFQPVLFNSRYYAIRRRVNKDGVEYYDTVGDGLTQLPEVPAEPRPVCGEGGLSTGRYAHLVHTFEKQYNYWGDFMPPYQAYFRGHDCMPDSSFYSSYRCYMKEAFVDRWSNFHSEEEYLCFIGHDMTDPWGSFDAEVEIWIGEDPEHIEKHIITEPTMLRIPAYMWHCPLQFKRVGKPIYFQVMCLRGQFATFMADTDDDGNPIIVYSGAGKQRPCKLEPGKSCNFCGRCWKDIEAADNAKRAAEAES